MLSLSNTFAWGSILAVMRVLVVGYSPHKRIKTNTAHGEMAWLLMYMDLSNVRDNLLPSGEVAERLKTMENCTVRYFRNYDNRLLLVHTIDLRNSPNVSAILHDPNMMPSISMYCSIFNLNGQVAE